MPFRPLRSNSVRSLPAAAVLLVIAAGAFPPPAGGQPADPKGQTWNQVDQGNDMKRVRDKMRVGEELIQEDLAFINQILLPQLEAPANRQQIERVVRRKLRDMQNVADNPATFEQFTKLIADFMVKLAREEKKEPVVRVNAVLLVGELNDESKRRPWPGGLAPLVAIVANQAVAPEVRIAAAAGLQRHADAARQSGQEAQAAFTEKAEPAIAALLTPAARIDRAAADWMTARGLAILRSIDAAVPAGAITTVAGIFDDESRPDDLRIRAAALVGAAKAKDLDPAKVVGTVEKIIGRLRQAEQAAADAKESRPGQPPAATPRRQAARRLAWRLSTLADALFTEDTKGGVAQLLAEPAPAKDLARRMRQAANDIDKNPDRDAVLEALDGITNAKPELEPVQQPAQPVKPTKPEPDDLFK